MLKIRPLTFFIRVGLLASLFAGIFIGVLAIEHSGSSSRASDTRSKQLLPAIHSGATHSQQSPTTPPFTSLPEAQSAKIRDAEVALAKAIQEDRVPKAQLNQFYNHYRNISDDARLLSQFPPKTAEAFANLHAVLQEEIHLQMKTEGKGAEFFQSPVEKTLSPQMVAHAIALEQLDVSIEAKKFIDQIAKAREVTTSNIERLAELCSAQWPCIEKGAYTWIKANHILSIEQHQLIQHYNPGS